MSRIALGCGALLLLVVGLGATCFLLQPTSYRITRSREVAASPAEVHALLADMTRLSSIDLRLGPEEPGRTRRVSPVLAVGPGAWIESTGPDGTSRLTVVSATDALVELASTTNGEPGATLRFELRPVATGTDVTFAAQSEMHGLARALWPVANLDGRVGPHMEGTLERLASALTSR